MIYWGSPKLFSNHTSRKTEQKRSTSLPTKLLRTYNSLLAVIDKNQPATGLRVNFSRKERSSSMNGLFIKDVIRGIIEGKYYRTVDVVLPLVDAFSDRRTGHDEHAPVTAMNTRYSDILTRLRDDCGSTVWT